MSFHRDVDFILGMDGSRFYCHNVHLVSQPPHSTVLVIIIILILIIIIFISYHCPNAKEEIISIFQNLQQVLYFAGLELSAN